MARRAVRLHPRGHGHRLRPARHPRRRCRARGSGWRRCWRTNASGSGAGRRLRPRLLRRRLCVRGLRRGGLPVSWRLARALGDAETRLAESSGDMLAALERGEAAIAFGVEGSASVRARVARSGLALAALEDYGVAVSRTALAPKGARNAALAEEFVAFLLSPEGQARLGEAALARAEADGADRLGRPPRSRSARPRSSTRRAQALALPRHLDPADPQALREGGRFSLAVRLTRRQPCRSRPAGRDRPSIGRVRASSAAARHNGAGARLASGRPAQKRIGEIDHPGVRPGLRLRLLSSASNRSSSLSGRACAISISIAAVDRDTPIWQCTSM